MNLDSAKEIALAVFSETYFDARQKVLATTPRSKAYRCGGVGPSGEALVTDAMYFGNPDAKQLLVLVSGTHGVEGYCGSAAQLAFLRAGFHEHLPSSAAVLIIHALNCHGFAWDRRTTVEGCDLNRNFIDFSKPIPANPGYDKLAEFLVPSDITQENIRRANVRIAAYREMNGETGFREALASGQFNHSGGMFYGGTRPTEARQVLENIVADFNLVQREKVITIDYHTGLGPYGYGELQCEQASGLDGYKRAVAIFGESVTSPDLGTSSSVVLHGTQDEFWQRLLGDRHTYVCFEFGTYDSERGLELLRNEQWLFAQPPDVARSEAGRKIRCASRLHFFPQAAEWREMVVSRSHIVHRQAVKSLIHGS